MMFVKVPPVNYNDVKEADYEEEQQQFAPQPKVNPSVAKFN